MTTSAEHIDAMQATWAADRPRDARWPTYLPEYQSNLFLPLPPYGLNTATHEEFTKGDGAELKDTRTRPAKMRALASSSALAVNFFDAWRDADKRDLSHALGLSEPIVTLSFEYKPKEYPVKPRSPNLDLVLELADGQRIAVESKFSEPYRSADGWSGMSARYFPAAQALWGNAELPAAQRIADRFRPEWVHLDVPQLLKHLLGLAHDPTQPRVLLYLWFDTGLPDAIAHGDEISRFAKQVAGDRVAFLASSYQQLFRKLLPGAEPRRGWHDYLKNRYFSEEAA